MEGVSFEQLRNFVVVVLVMVGAYNAIMTAYKNWREEKKRKSQPVSNLEAIVADHSEKLKQDHERLTELEEGNRIIMRALMALLSHDINGNSDDKLKASFDEIQKYLIEK